ncbi:MAG: substrate-binding domain-containing protein [Candidatus Latescibacteria bacterium]|nr:substrate-binding domain-containing protein [Candidatus Latescibacterota bacterium]
MVTGPIWQPVACHQKTQTVGIVLLPLDRDLGLQMLSGINQQLQSNGLTSIIDFSRMDYTREVEAVRRMSDEGVGGILINSARIAQEPTHLHELDEQGMPYVLIDLAVEGIGGCYVGQKNRLAATRLTRLLIEAGHRRLACVGQLFQRRTKSDRLAGFQDAVAESAGATEKVINLSDLSSGDEQRSEVDAGQMLDTLREFLRPDDAPTAFFAMDTRCLHWLMTGLTALGLRVPDDISVVSFDAIDDLRCLGLQITTNVVPGYQMGLEAARMLVEQIGGRQLSERETVLEFEPEIVLGNSVGPPLQ